MNTPNNETQKQLSIEEDRPSNWFEPLYLKASKDGDGVRWANMKTHPSFANWLAENPQIGAGKPALVVGCGMGDDAIELESLGFHVTAFDVSATAIEYCKERFPNSKVNFEQADLLEDQAQWQGKFDFVLEIFTVQALPPKYEKELVQNISSFVAPGGQLLVISEVGNEHRAFENGPPWLLTREHVDAFVSCGLMVEGKVVEKVSAHIGEELYITAFNRP
jgi:SAM-dependent methyltransferase